MLGSIPLSHRAQGIVFIGHPHPNDLRNGNFSAHRTRKIVFQGGTYAAGRRQAKIQAWNHKQAVKAHHRAVKRARMGT